MADVLQWIGLALGISVFAFGVSGFVGGPSLPPNPPARRLQIPRHIADPADRMQESAEHIAPLHDGA